MRLRCRIELAPKQASVRNGRARLCIDSDALHLRYVDHQTLVDKGCAGSVVAARANGREDIVVGGEPHRSANILPPGATKNRVGTAIDHPVPDLPGGFVI